MSKGYELLTDAQRKRIGQKGGMKISEDREHMAKIGRAGGIKSGESRRRKKLERDGLSQ